MLRWVLNETRIDDSHFWNVEYIGIGICSLVLEISLCTECHLLLPLTRSFLIVRFEPLSLERQPSATRQNGYDRHGKGSRLFGFCSAIKYLNRTCLWFIRSPTRHGNLKPQIRLDQPGPLPRTPTPVPIRSNPPVDPLRPPLIRFGLLLSKELRPRNSWGGSREPESGRKPLEGIQPERARCWLFAKSPSLHASMCIGLLWNDFSGN